MFCKLILIKKMGTVKTDSEYILNASVCNSAKQVVVA